VSSHNTSPLPNLLLTVEPGATSLLLATWLPDNKPNNKPQPQHTMKMMRNNNVHRFQSMGLGEFSQCIPPPQSVINSGTRCHVTALGDVATRQQTEQQHRLLFVIIQMTTTFLLQPCLGEFSPVPPPQYIITLETGATSPLSVTWQPDDEMTTSGCRFFHQDETMTT